MWLGGRRSIGLVRFCFMVAGVAAVGSCTLVRPDEGPGTAVETAVLPMAQAALDAGQVETARRLYSRLLEVDERSVAARTGLGRVAMAERDAAKAASWYLAAAVHATLPEERHEALLAHGRAALAAGQHEAALRSFARLASVEEKRIRHARRMGTQRRRHGALAGRRPARCRGGDREGRASRPGGAGVP